MLRGITLLATISLTTAAAGAQGQLTAQLVANDAIDAHWTDTSTGTIGAQQSTPAGPLTGTTVQVGYGANPSYARYSCAIAPDGDGQAFTASSSCYSQFQAHPSTHADLTLTISGNGHAYASVDVLLQHFGDFPGLLAFRVDVGDDGSEELSSWLNYTTDYSQRRLWIWDFGDGDLVLRIRTDQGWDPAPQAHSLDLLVRPWAPGAAPDAAGSATIARLPLNGSYAHTNNYALVAEAPAQPQHAMDLRAFGMGQFSLFLVSDVGTTAPLLLPPPWNTPSPALSNVLLFDYGVVTATVPLPPASPTPREWRLPVPQLPPGLTFYVQHASANQFYAFWFGTSNVVRIDT